MRPKKKKKKLMHSGKVDKGRFPRQGKAKNKAMEDGFGGKEGMKKAHRKSEISFWLDDYHAYPNYDYLRRWLRQHTGRLWDDVYSDLCEMADCRTSTGAEFRHAIEHTVELRCHIEGDEVRSDRGHLIGGFWGQDEFYVHPYTNKLEVSCGSHRLRQTKRPDTVFDIDGQSFYKFEGIWYRVKFKTCHWARLINDVFYGYGPSWNTNTSFFYKKYGLGQDGQARYCFWKQSANSKEIKKLKLME